MEIYRTSAPTGGTEIVVLARRESERNEVKEYLCVKSTLVLLSKYHPQQNFRIQNTEGGRWPWRVQTTGENLNIWLSAFHYFPTEISRQTEKLIVSYRPPVMGIVDLSRPQWQQCSVLPELYPLCG